MVCINCDIIKVVVSLGVGVLVFLFVDLDEVKIWSDIYYDIIKSDVCVLIGYFVNVNIVMVLVFLFYEDWFEVIWRG